VDDQRLSRSVVVRKTSFACAPPCAQSRVGEMVCQTRLARAANPSKSARSLGSLYSPLSPPRRHTRRSARTAHTRAGRNSPPASGQVGICGQLAMLIQSRTPSGGGRTGDLGFPFFRLGPREPYFEKVDISGDRYPCKFIYFFVSGI
jgi:hypothetical protein